MKTIKIFLASSEELKEERDQMTVLVSRLNYTFKGRGIELEVMPWEFLDASMSNQRKQDEYNKVLKACDICMVMFWRKFGSYTGEELDVAYQSNKDKVKPEKIYVFFKNPDGDDVTSELKDFIKNYERRYGGHFFCKFQNVDAMKLEFLLQFELYQKDLLGEKTIEVRNNKVYINSEALVDLKNIPFVFKNEEFKKRQLELKELHDDIADMQAMLQKKKNKLERKKADFDKNPDDKNCLEDYNDAKEDVERLKDDLQKRLDCKNALKEEFEREQQYLFNTARRITKLRGQKISERMNRAIEAFERGDAQRADVILDEAEKDFEATREDFRLTKKVSIHALEEQIQRVSCKMSNITIPIEERINKTREIYGKVDAFAQEINYDQEKHIDLLVDYSRFLLDYAFYDEAEKNYLRLISMQESFYGIEHSKTSKSYNRIGIVYGNKGDYERALGYLFKAMAINEKVLGKKHPDTAASYDNIGVIYANQNDYNKALEYYLMAVNIREKVLGIRNSKTAGSYNNIGEAYHAQGDYDTALKFHFKALKIRENVLGSDSSGTAMSNNNIGSVYMDMGYYEKAFKYYFKALTIYKKIYGPKHPITTKFINSIIIEKKS